MSKNLVSGKFWTFDCMNAFLEDRLFPVDSMTKEAAVNTAADYEAVLELVTVRDGGLVSRDVVYDPFDF